MRKPSRRKLPGGALVVAAAVAALPFMLTGQDRSAEDPGLEGRIRIDKSPVTRSGGVARSYADVVDRVQPSVVSIYTSKTIQSRYNDLLWYYGHRLRREDLPKQTGLGSGVVITPDGYILTNNHVVGDADEIKVALADGREFVAKLVGRDAESEVAVIKIDAKGLPAITIADSENVRVGDVVLAFGNPFGLEQTVSMGIVSGKGRKNTGIARYGDFIQTDASINPGNSGGALVDADGRLIGINTAIFTQTGGSMGIGFAIPAVMAMKVVDVLVAEGKVSRGFLGVTMGEVTEEFANYLNLKDRNGVVVAKVVRHTPAHRAGLRPYDLILEFDGKPATDPSKLSNEISERKPGTEVSFKILRDGRVREVSAVLSDRATPYENFGTPKRVAREETETSRLARGVLVTELTDSIRARLRMRGNVEGVVVSEVTRDAPRKNARLSPGDLVIEIDRQPVRSLSDLARVKDAAGDGRILVRVIGIDDGETRLYVLDP